MIQKPLLSNQATQSPLTLEHTTHTIKANRTQNQKRENSFTRTKKNIGKRSKREWDPPVFLVALSLDFGLVLGLASVKGIEKGCADQSTNGS